MLMTGSFFDNLESLGHERESFEDFFAAGDVRIERIVSRGHASPESGYYAQDWTEVVIVLCGQAKVEMEESVYVLSAGDWLAIKPRMRHRVLETSQSPACVWCAIHIGERGSADK